MSTHSTPTNTTTIAQSISTHYNLRAKTYDDATTFHQSLAKEYVKYAKPLNGEKLLDLACGTGLVVFALNSQAPLSIIHGIDISSSMLEVARSKILDTLIHPNTRKQSDELASEQPHLPTIRFDEHDITSLSTLPSLSDLEGMFDIITICSAFVLLPSPLEALKSWIPYLNSYSTHPLNPIQSPSHQIPLEQEPFGGRLILDIPHPSSMLGLSIFSKLSPEFDIPILGSRNWIGRDGEEGIRNLKELMKGAGLVGVQAFETKRFADIPARTPGMMSVDGGNEFTEWEATSKVGMEIFEEMIKGQGMQRWREGSEEEKWLKKNRWVEEWVNLGSKNEKGEMVVREEGRLIIGVGFKG